MVLLTIYNGIFWVPSGPYFNWAKCWPLSRFLPVALYFGPPNGGTRGIAARRESDRASRQEKPLTPFGVLACRLSVKWLAVIQPSGQQLAICLLVLSPHLTWLELGQNENSPTCPLLNNKQIDIECCLTRDYAIVEAAKMIITITSDRTTSSLGYKTAIATNRPIKRVDGPLKLYSIAACLVKSCIMSAPRHLVS